MDYQQEELNVTLSMLLGAGLGMIVCSTSFAIFGTIGAIAWIELIPPRVPIDSLIHFIFQESPIEIGTIPGAAFGLLSGTLWGVFDSRLGELGLKIIRGDFGWYKLLRQIVLIIILGSVLLSVLGIFVTSSLWLI